MPLLFAVASAGIISSPYGAPLAVGHGLAYPSLSYPSYAHAAPIVSAPVVKHIAPVAYSAPVVKTVLPAATSYSNTYKVSYIK